MQDLGGCFLKSFLFMKQKIDRPYLLHIKEAIEAIETFIRTLED